MFVERSNQEKKGTSVDRLRLADQRYNLMEHQKNGKQIDTHDSPCSVSSNSTERDDNNVFEVKMRGRRGQVEESNVLSTIGTSGDSLCNEPSHHQQNGRPRGCEHAHKESLVQQEEYLECSDVESASADDNEQLLFAKQAINVFLNTPPISDPTGRPPINIDLTSSLMWPPIQGPDDEEWRKNAVERNYQELVELLERKTSKSFMGDEEEEDDNCSVVSFSGGAEGSKNNYAEQTAPGKRRNQVSSRSSLERTEERRVSQ